MKIIKLSTAAIAAVCVLSQAQAQLTISALSGFSPNGDGWFAPAEGGYGFLGTANLERGLAYGNGELYLVSRNGGNFIRRLNPLTGAEVGTLNMTGVSGGSGAAINMVAVANDGVIYAGNLVLNSATSPFKIYRWASPTATPTTAYSGNPLTSGRFGDSLAVNGIGASTILAAGSATSSNGYALIDPTAGTGSYVNFLSGPAVGSFRLGIDFTDATHVIGSQGSSALQYSTTSGSYLGAGTLSTASQRPLGYTVLGGMPLLGVVDTVDGILRVYDASNPLSLGSPLLFGTAPPFAHNSNGNATGDVAWGDQFWDGSKWNSYLYAMDSNNGIQAWIVSVPEPSSLALALLGGAFVGFNHLRRKKRS